MEKNENLVPAGTEGEQEKTTPANPAFEGSRFIQYLSADSELSFILHGKDDVNAFYLGVRDIFASNPKLERCSNRSIMQTIREVAKYYPRLAPSIAHPRYYFIPINRSVDSAEHASALNKDGTLRKGFTRFGSALRESRCTLMIGYTGAKILINAKKFIARAVYSDEEFSCCTNETGGTVINHIQKFPKLSESKDREVVAAYVIAYFEDGQTQAVTVNAEDLQYCRSINENNKFWKERFEEMAKKTVIRRLLKENGHNLCDVNEPISRTDPEMFILQGENE